MQQFIIPQFIDVETKIIGPITARQFTIFMAGVLLMALFYRLFDFSLFLTLSIFIFILSALFSFGKINGLLFHRFLLTVIGVLGRPAVRCWNHRLELGDFSMMDVESTKKEEENFHKEYLGESRLTELSLIVDTLGGYKGELENNQKNIRALE